MNDSLPSFPVDDVTLAAVLHGMQGAYEVDEEGVHTLIGGDYALSQLLDFLSGYDVEAVIPIGPNIVEYVGGVVYTEHDIIRALIDEVNRLRGDKQR